jgi:hypothetical protein
MKAFTTLFAFLTALTFVGCSGKKITTDYDPDFPIASLHTFSLPKSDDSVDPLNAQRIEDALTRALEAKGYRRVPSGGDFAVSYRMRVLKDVPSNVTIGFGIGGGARNMGVSMGTAKTLTHNEARFEIVMTDPKSGRVFWNASTAKEIDTDATPQEREAYIRDEVERMLQSFPKANP